jgi:hypothetical protein
MQAKLVTITTALKARTDAAAMEGNLLDMIMPNGKPLGMHGRVY